MEVPTRHIMTHNSRGWLVALSERTNRIKSVLGF